LCFLNAALWRRVQKTHFREMSRGTRNSDGSGIADGEDGVQPKTLFRERAEGFVLKVPCSNSKCGSCIGMIFPPKVIALASQLPHLYRLFRVD